MIGAQLLDLLDGLAGHDLVVRMHHGLDHDVSPESTLRTGGCALLNQPHCAVSVWRAAVQFARKLFAGQATDWAAASAAAMQSGMLMARTRAA